MRIRNIILLIMLSIFIFTATGCWNYREIESLGIVAGIAIDTDESGSYLLTIEVVDLAPGREIPRTSKKIEARGETMLESVRNAITISGKRLYWSHVKVVILSKDMAKKGIREIVDWLYRDSESRLTLHVLVSKEKTAREVLEAKGVIRAIVSYEIDEMFMYQKSLSKLPNIKVNDIVNALEGDGIALTLPVIKVAENGGIKTPALSGLGVFKGDKIIGFLNENETMGFMFITNRFKAGVLVENPNGNNRKENISIEVFSNKTKLKPLILHDKLTIVVNTFSDTAIAEQGTDMDYSIKENYSKLKGDVEKSLEGNMVKLVEKVQREFGVDIFGFGQNVKWQNPSYWRENGQKWDEVFRNINIKVSSDIAIRNTSLASKPVKAGE